MGKKEYMEILLSQIRNDKAKEMVSEEIGAHIDDQTDTYMEFGLDSDTAEKKAVRSMGDPVETGVSLDRIHKPKMSWGMIVLVAILSVLGLAIQGLSWAQTGEMFFFQRQVGFVIIGFVCMMLICMIDYSRIVNHGKVLAVLYLILTVLFMARGDYVNGSLWVHIGGVSFSWHLIMYLSIPLFGVLLYQYRKLQKIHLLIPVGFMVVVLFLFDHIGRSRLVFINLIFMAAIILTYAIVKGWYPVKIKRFLAVFWICFAAAFTIIPTLVLLRLASTRAYVVDRLGHFINSDEGAYAVYGTFRPIREVLRESVWFGGGQVDMANTDVNSILSDYVLLHVTASYGIWVLLVILALLVYLCYKIFHLSMKQKNQQGMILGISCGLIFAVQIGEYVLMNLGLIPGTTVFLPMFSYGGTGTVVAYILLGLLLSIYRYQNLVTERKTKKRLVVEWKEV